MSNLFSLFIFIILICVYIFSLHFHHIEPDAYIFEEYFSISQNKPKIRIISPCDTPFTIRRKSKTKRLRIPNEPITFDVEGVLSDFTEYKIKLNYSLHIPNDEKKRKMLFDTLIYGSAAKNLLNIKETLNMFSRGIIREELSKKKYFELNSYDEFANIIFSLGNVISKNFDHMIDMKFISVSVEFNNCPEKTFKQAKLTYEDLLIAGYNRKQINQILKAGEKGICLSNVNPIVSDKIFRKIREIYNEGNTQLKNYIHKLTIISTSANEIDNICNEILEM